MTGLTDSLVYIINCIFTSNHADLFGTLYIKNSGNIIITNCIFANNSAEKGGAIYYEEDFECK